LPPPPPGDRAKLAYRPIGGAQDELRCIGKGASAGLQFAREEVVETAEFAHPAGGFGQVDVVGRSEAADQAIA
jgi:hypothetical protein